MGGPHAPYRQSQRHDIYREVLDKLIAAGAVYESYSTAEEIDARNEANGRAKQLGYDNFDRDLTDEQKAAFRAEGREPAWRLRVPDHDLTYVDLIRGEVTFPAGSFPDFVLVRAGGVPLYPFVNPVDDALMGITHVIRGEDLCPRPRVSSRCTARWSMPASRLSSRGSRTCRSSSARPATRSSPSATRKADLFLQREKGFIHEGLLNYLSLLGWSIGPDRDVFSLDELIAAFDIVDVNPNPARFDQKKAESINGDHIRMLEPADFAARIVHYLACRRTGRRNADTRTAGADRGIRPARAGARAAARRGARAARLPLPRRRSRTTTTRSGRCLRTPARCWWRPSARWSSCPRPNSPPPPCRRHCRQALIEGLALKPRVAYTPAARGAQRSPHLATAVRVHGAPRQGRVDSPSRCPRPAPGLIRSVWQAARRRLDLIFGTTSVERLGVWCNWQHGGFWYLCSWFESRYPSTEKTPAQRGFFVRLACSSEPEQTGSLRRERARR